MLNQFRKILLENDLIAQENTILLAVSGGIDSMAMTELFRRTEIKICIAHCNFHLRGTESDEDAKFVEEYARKNNIEFFLKDFQTEEYARNNKVSIQMAARDLRYEWFEELRHEINFDYIATAHNRDDQIETFFINLLRGTGIKGLSGMILKKAALLRPMIHFSRIEIQDYTKSVGLNWREDHSNASVKYRRNKIRHEILPVFRNMNPSFDVTMEDNIRKLIMVQEIYLKYTVNRKESILTRSGSDYEISIPALKAEEFSESICFEILNDFGFSASTISDILHSLDSIPGKLFYSDTHRLIKDREVLIIEPLKPDIKHRYYIEENQKELIFPVKMKFRKISISGFTIPPYSDIACLDYSKLDFPLILRKWETGDYFYPLGMKDSKKVSDFFIDNKLSISQKEKTWLLCSGRNIVWVAGHRLDERFKITPSTSTVYKVSLVD